MVNLRLGHGGNYNYGTDVIDFSSNINPIKPPWRLKKEIIRNWEKITSYPDPEAKDLRMKLARYWKIKIDNILIGNGAVELIYLVCLALKPEKVLIFIPTFSEYERASKIIKSKIKFKSLNKNNFELTPSNKLKPDLTFICNPNNPTGNLLLKNRNLNFKSKFFVIDEAFMDFLPQQKRLTFIPKAVESKRIIVIRSFTKFFSIPGLRLGYLIAHKDVISLLKKYQVPWNVNSFAQIAAKILLNERDYILKTKKVIEKERNFLWNEINKIKNLECFPSVTNFLLIKIKDKYFTAKLLKKLLLDKKVLIRDCSNFRGLNSKFVRIAVRSHKENLKLITALKELL